MRIFITGVNGLVGSNLANNFIAKGHEVTGLGRQIKLNKNVDSRCNYVQADITSPLGQIVADVVIHAAALASDKAEYSDLYMNNVLGTVSVLEASSSVNTFIHISTCDVYHLSEIPSKEEEAGVDFDTLSNYGKTKFLAEQEVLKNKTIPNRCILRPHAIYGQNDNTILPRLLHLIKGKFLILPQHIAKVACLTNVRNLAYAAELLIHKPKTESIYNVADDEIYSLQNVILELLSEVTARELKVLPISKTIWQGMINLNKLFKFDNNMSQFGSDHITKTSLVDISNIKKVLNYYPQHTLYSSYSEISQWVYKTGGWKHLTNNERKK